MLRTLAVAGCVRFAAEALRLDEASKRSAAREEQAFIPKARPLRDDHACACQNWKWMYENKMVECGQGVEYWEKGTDKQAIMAADDELCKVPEGSGRRAFYPAQDHAWCMPFMKAAGPERRIDGSWCYVPADCMWPGTHEASDFAAWKPCDEKDGKLRDLDPHELFYLAKKINVSAAEMALRAYDWSEVEGMWEADPASMMQTFDGDMEWPTAWLRKTEKATITVRDQVWEVREDGGRCLENCPNIDYSKPPF